MKLQISVLLCLTGTCLLFADTPDYTAWIGMDPPETVSVFGVPSHVYPHRGDRPREDNVVFYRDGIYLFLFENRVWQVRADRNSGAIFAGVQIGDTLEKLSTVLGEPLYTGTDGSLYFEISRKSYPLRLRVVFDSDNRVDDLYLYRGDY